MRFYRNIYVSDSLRDQLWKIKWKLKHHKFMPGIYVIVLPEYSNELEFYHCKYLQQNYYKKHAPCIVGIANSWEESCKLIAKMMIDSFEQYGSYCVGEYIRNSVSNY